MVGEGNVETKTLMVEGSNSFPTLPSNRPVYQRLFSASQPWILILVTFVLVAEVGLRIPAVYQLLPDPVPRLWHALLVQDKLDYLVAMEELQGVDILFIGNSTTQAGINPTIFDETRFGAMTTEEAGSTDVDRGSGSFNASIEGLPPFGIEMFLPIFLKRAQPEVIIYGLSAQDLNSASPWAVDVTERVNHSPLALAESEKGVRGWFLARLLRFSQLYRYRPILLQTIIMGSKQDSHLEEVYFDDRGHDAISYRRLADIPGDERAFMRNNAGVLNYQAEGLQVKSLTTIIKESKALGIELILVNMPLADDYYINFDRPEDYEGYRTTLAEIAAANGILLMDMEGIAANDFTDDDFADFNHLNADGAIRLSKMIAEQFVDQLTN